MRAFGLPVRHSGGVHVHDLHGLRRARSMKCFVLAACALGTAGCGGATLSSNEDAGATIAVDGGVTVERDGEGVAIVAGTAGGIAFDARGAIDAVTYGHLATIFIPENFSQTCAGLQQATRERSVQAQSRLLDVLLNGPEPTGPGEYVVVQSMPSDAGPTIATAIYRAADAYCAFTDEYAESGKVVLTAVTAQALEGRLDLVFANGNALSGTFAAPVCAIVPPAIEVLPPPVKCVP